MSDDERAFVWDHSPYRGTMKLIHLKMADWANEGHEWMLWCGDAVLSDKAGCDRRTVVRAKAQMVRDGYLTDLHERHSNGNRLYRFEMPHPDQCDISSTSPNETFHPPNETFHPDQCDISSTPPITNQKNQPEEPNPHVNALCEFLQAGVERHRGVKPKQGAGWGREMDLLLRRGPTTWAKPRAVSEQEVATVIRGVFTQLNVLSNGGFCWADQIRSPTNLRKHWDELVLALKDRPKKGNASNGDGSDFLTRKVSAKYANR